MNVSLIFFLRYFFSNRAGAVIRTMARLCWFATLIGVFSLIVVSSVMNGFNRSIREKLLSVEPHLMVYGGTDVIDATKKFIQMDAGSKDSSVQTFYKQDVILRTVQDGRFSGAIVKALPPVSIYNFLTQVHKLNLKKGHASASILPESTQLEPTEIMMGSDLARELNVFEGDEVMLISPESLLGPAGEAPKYERMRVKSLFTTEFAEVDSKLILFNLPASPLRFQSGISGESGVEVYLDRPDRFEELKDMLSAHLTDLKKNSVIQSDFRIESWADRNKALFFALRLEKVAMTTFLGLSVLITCFSLVTVLVMLISQKRKEIGLLMSIGYSKAKTSRLFLQLGVFLSGLGLFAGLFLGVLVSWLIEKYPLEILPDIYYDSTLPSEINSSFVVGAAVFCLLIALFAAYWPVRLYLKKTPAENLRPQMSE